MVDLPTSTRQRSLQVLERIRTSNLSRWGFNFFEGPGADRTSTSCRFLASTPHRLGIHLHISSCHVSLEKFTLQPKRSDGKSILPWHDNNEHPGTDTISIIPVDIQHPARVVNFRRAKKKNYFRLMRVSKVWHNRPIEGYRGEVHFPAKLPEEFLGGVEKVPPPFP